MESSDVSTGPMPSELEQRVARLERLVEELVRSDGGEQVDRRAEPVARPAPHAPARRGVGTGEAQRPPPRAAAAQPLPAWTRELWSGEFWLNKLGIALVLFGVTFLFRYSIEQGWLTPGVRVAFGAAVGAVLMISGLRLRAKQRSLAQVLVGGGIGVFYIVVFAAFQLYELLGYGPAFAAMVGITLLAFALAVREDHAWLALIGAKGALGTPFLLYSGAGDVVWLLGYTAVVVAACAALVVLRGWRSLLWTVALGGWAVHLVAFTQSFAPAGMGTDAERWAMQGTILFFWALFALVIPAWEHRTRLAATGGSPGRDRAAVRSHLHLLALLTPLAALGLTVALWEPEAQRWGWGAVAFGGAYAAAAAALLARDRSLAHAQLFAGGVVVAVGFVAALGAERLYVSLAVLALFHLAAAGRLGTGWAAAVGHLLAAIVAIWFLVRLDSGGIQGNWRAAADPLVIGAAFLAAREAVPLHARRIYLSAIHLGVLAFLWRELNPVAGGAALVSGAWGGYALALMALGVTRNLDLVQKTALGTILLVVAKLFLVDLAALEALWRILLFLGFGGLLLLASYVLQGAWRAAAPPVEPPPVPIRMPAPDASGGWDAR
jgi:uncharacterized membrane protein